MVTRSTRSLFRTLTCITMIMLLTHCGPTQVPAQAPEQIDPEPKFETTLNLCKVYPVNGSVKCLSYDKVKLMPPGTSVLDRHQFINGNQFLEDILTYNSLKNLFDIYFDGKDGKFDGKRVQFTDTLIDCGNGVTSDVNFGDIANPITDDKEAKVQNACLSTFAELSDTDLAPGGRRFVSKTTIDNAISKGDQQAESCVYAGSGMIAFGWQPLFQAIGVVADLLGIGGFVTSVIDHFTEKEKPTTTVEPLEVTKKLESDGSTTTTVIAQSTTKSDSKTETETVIIETATDSQGNLISETTNRVVTTTSSEGKVVVSSQITVDAQGKEVVNGVMVDKYDSNGNLISRTPATSSSGKSCDAMEMRCTSACEDYNNWWNSFKNYCNSVNWQDYECQSYINSAGNCADPAITMPLPDGDYHCGTFADSETIAQAMERFCQERQGIMSVSSDDEPVCRITVDQTPLLGGGNFNICNDPNAQYLEEQCLLDIPIEIGSPTHDFTPEPPPNP